MAKRDRSLVWSSDGGDLRKAREQGRRRPGGRWAREGAARDRRAAGEDGHHDLERAARRRRPERAGRAAEEALQRRQMSEEQHDRAAGRPPRRRARGAARQGLRRRARRRLGRRPPRNERNRLAARLPLRYRRRPRELQPFCARVGHVSASCRCRRPGLAAAHPRSSRSARPFLPIDGVFCVSRRWSESATAGRDNDSVGDAYFSWSDRRGQAPVEESRERPGRGRFAVPCTTALAGPEVSVHDQSPRPSRRAARSRTGAPAMHTSPREASCRA